MLCRRPQASSEVRDASSERPVREAKTAARLLRSEHATKFPTPKDRVNFDVEQSVGHPRDCIRRNEKTEGSTCGRSGDHFDAR